MHDNSMSNPFLTGSLQLSITIDTLEWFGRVHHEGEMHQMPSRDPAQLLGQQQETLQTASATAVGINSAPVDLMPCQPTNMSTYLSVNREQTDDPMQPYVTDIDGFLIVDLPPTYPETKSQEANDSEQPYMTTISNLPEFYIVEFPSSSYFGMPKSDYFPVSHMVLNSVDLSLTVANIGLCVMIYSFLPSKPTTAVKVCTHGTCVYAATAVTLYVIESLFKLHLKHHLLSAVCLEIVSQGCY